jgi:tetraacyldisaccharide 4'-kinase
VLSRLYGASVARRNRRFDTGKGIVEFDRPVISVGNLSVGGTGKTPMVMHLVEVLQRAGHRPCIAMRGYKPGPGGESDEASEYKRVHPEISVVAQPNRTDGLIRLFATEPGEKVDSVLLDDGFQHRRIARQIDIVIVDGAGHPPDERLLPAGWLREPAASMSRATHAVVMRTSQSSQSDIDRNLRWLEGTLGAARVAVCSRQWTHLQVLDAGVERTEQSPWLAGKRVLAVCAIGNPGQFIAQVALAVGGSRQTPSLALRDHDPYSEQTIGRMIETAKRESVQAIVVTEKDWSKLRRVGADRWRVPIVRPRLGLRFERGREQLEADVVDMVRKILADAQAVGD